MLLRLDLQYSLPPTTEFIASTAFIDQVEDDLLQLDPIGQHSGRDLDQLGVPCNLLTPEFVAEDCEDAENELIRIERGSGLAFSPECCSNTFDYFVTFHRVIGAVLLYLNIGLTFVALLCFAL